MHENQSENALYDEAKHIRVSFETEHTKLIETLQNESKRPNIFNHICLLIQRRLLSNFKDINFYIRQLLIPLLVTFLGCFIGKFLSKNISLTMSDNLSELSKTSPFLIPISHSKVRKPEEINRIFLEQMKEFGNFDLKAYIKSMNDSKNFEFCDFDTGDICKLNETPLWEILRFIFNFITLKNIKHNYYVQLVNKCDFDKFLLRTTYLYSFKR